MALWILFGFGACHWRAEAGVRDHARCWSDESLDPEQHCINDNSHAGGNVRGRISARISLASAPPIWHALAGNFAVRIYLLPAGRTQRGATDFDLCLAEDRDVGVDRPFSVAVAADAS